MFQFAIPAIDPIGWEFSGIALSRLPDNKRWFGRRSGFSSLGTPDSDILAHIQAVYDWTASV